MTGGTRGRLRVYLGAAPGVGKTFAMLAEGRRRAERGTDVVVGFLETHGRPRTAAAAEGLELLPRRTVRYRDAEWTELDLPGLLARHPQVALVDELAHSNVAGVEHPKRWQDVHDLLAAGIDVITTVNIQHLESVNDVVEHITGIQQRETVPDWVVRAAEQIELIDQTPEALRRRLAHGNIYTPDKVDAALANYFRVGNLTALRELALLWLADRVDEGLQRYRTEQGIETTWETRERVVVALTGGPEGETLIRRAARIAARSGGDLLAVHVARTDGLPGASAAQRLTQRALVESLGGSYHVVASEDPPRALLELARAENATQIVLGASRRSRLSRALFGLGTAATVIRHSGDIDVHIVTHEHAGGGRGRLPRPGRAGLTRRRRLVGAGLTVVGQPLLTVGLAALRGSLNLPSLMLLYLAATVTVALVGGLVPGLLSAVLASLLLNYYFTPPLYTFTISERNNVLALLVFVAVAAAVAAVVDLAARRTREAARRGAEADVLATLAGSVLRSPQPLRGLARQAQQTFGARSVVVQERSGDGWIDLESAGTTDGPAGPDEEEEVLPVGSDGRLVLRGRRLAAEDRRLLAAFAAHAAAALDAQRLAREAGQARELAQANRIRTALLAAVSHDLRSPLAAIKVAISSLRSARPLLSQRDVEDLQATIEESTDRLQGLVSNLLDLSRLTTGALNPLVTPVSAADVVDSALQSLPEEGPGERRRVTDRVQVDIPEEGPAVLADPGLLERALANLVDNALVHTPPGTPVRVTASSHGERVEIRVADRGPGLSEEAKARCFEPFQRLGDVPQGSGVGLGLAVARGFVETMGGAIVPEDTPGGGLTMTVSLPAAPLPAGEMTRHPGGLP